MTETIMTEKYQTSKIYRLQCEDGHYYIGATTQALDLRLKNHRNLSSTGVNNAYTYMNTVGWDTITIVLIEEYACASKQELNKREEFYIKEAKEDNFCLNHAHVNNYKKGKIYRLLCFDGHYYYGSTTQRLNYRFHHHKHAAKEGTSRVYTHLRTVGVDTVIIELVEDYPCNSLKELYEREDLYIQDALHDEMCLNHHRAYVSPIEKQYQQIIYTEEHRQESIERTKRYRAAHHEEILKKEEAFRQAHRAELAAKQRDYMAVRNITHAEELKEARVAYNQAHKERIYENCKKYNAAHKEEIAAYKKEWAKKKAEEQAETIAAEREQARLAREQQSAERVKKDRAIHTCECGGTYQFYQKKRHMDSKKHATFLIHL